MNTRYAEAGAVFTTLRAELPASRVIAYPLAHRYNTQVDNLSDEFPVRLDEFKIAPEEFGDEGVDARIFVARIEALTRFLSLFREQKRGNSKAFRGSMN